MVSRKMDHPRSRIPTPVAVVVLVHGMRRRSEAFRFVSTFACQSIRTPEDGLVVVRTAPAAA